MSRGKNDKHWLTITVSLVKPGIKNEECVALPVLTCPRKRCVVT